MIADEVFPEPGRTNRPPPSTFKRREADRRIVVSEFRSLRASPLQSHRQAALACFAHNRLAGGVMRVINPSFAIPVHLWLSIKALEWIAS